MHHQRFCGVGEGGSNIKTPTYRERTSERSGGNFQVKVVPPLPACRWKASAEWNITIYFLVEK